MNHAEASYAAGKHLNGPALLNPLNLQLTGIHGQGMALASFGALSYESIKQA